MHKIIIFIITLLISLFIAFSLNILFINTTDSLPLGIYYNSFKQNIDKNDIVVFCQTKNFAQISLNRGYTKTKLLSPCPLQSQTLIKPVVAVFNDNIEINSKGVFVNHKFVINSKQVAEVLKINSIKLNLIKKLNKNELLVISSYNPYSWDGRYFGVIKLNQVIAVAKPLITFDKP